MQGDWEKALDTAAEHGQEVLHKYLATHATGLIKDGQATQALQLYRKYGCPTFPQNFNIYKRIAVDLFGRYCIWIDIIVGNVIKMTNLQEHSRRCQGQNVLCVVWFERSAL